MSSSILDSVYVTIPSTYIRLHHLLKCLGHLKYDPEKLVIVTNGEQPLNFQDIEGYGAANLLVDYTPGLNISRWWNLGIEWIAKHAPERHEVLVLNDDCEINVEGVKTLVCQLRAFNLAMVGPDHKKLLPEGSPTHIETRLKSIPWGMRPPGFCFMLAGEKSIRADEEAPWWFSDDCVEWQARQMGGTGLVPGVEVKHPESGGTICNSSELRRLNKLGEDRFRKLYGCYPVI